MKDVKVLRMLRMLRTGFFDIFFINICCCFSLPQKTVPQAAKMWSVLRARSKQVRHVGHWSEFLDEASNEVFFYNSSEGTCQWECPPELKIDYQGHVPLSGHHSTASQNGSSDYSITL